jgi:hypothetical protein
MSATDRLGALRKSFVGELIVPGDSGYDECRKVFNAMHDKRPAVIALARMISWSRFVQEATASRA